MRVQNKPQMSGKRVRLQHIARLARLLSFIALYTGASTAVWAQETKTENTRAAQTKIDTVQQESERNSNTLRLQDTIRANKEQPQVLTIVPWQLPAHQRIDQDKQWQLQVTPMAPIERGTFLKNLRLIKQLEADQNQ